MTRLGPHEYLDRTYHELGKLLVELLLVGHRGGGGDGLEGEAAPAAIRNAVGDLWRLALAPQTSAPASSSSPASHLGVKMSRARAGGRVSARLPLEAGELRREAGTHLGEVGLGQLRPVDLGEAQASEHLRQAGAREPVAQAVKLHIGKRVQNLKIGKIELKCIDIILSHKH